MDFLLIDYNSAKCIVSSKLFQSVDYEYGAKLFKFLTDENCPEFEIDGFHFLKTKNGTCILDGNERLNKAVVFDLSVFHGFKGEKKHLSLLILQKVLRFAIRSWENISHVKGEKIINTTKAVVFPFGFADTYRVLIDKSPDEKRAQKRNTKHLLVFQDGHENNYEIDNISVTKFRKALTESSERLSTNVPTTTGESQPSCSLGVTEIHVPEHSAISSYIGFENWQYHLTEQQKEFIFKDNDGPERLEGAAGTGKTISLILRCIYQLKKAIQNKKTKHMLFITHSLATKNHITGVFEANFPDIVNYYDRYQSNISLKITTLQEWCIFLLGKGIEETEYLDRDAQDSKELQLLYLLEAIEEINKKDYESYKKFLSEDFIDFFEHTEDHVVAELMQHEIAVVIKGRAQEDLDQYKAIKRPQYGIPAKVEGDLNLLFLVFQKYQSKLRDTGQYDSDDIVLTSIGQLNTPIWRRRRDLEGYDLIFIDETHLFNMNELSTFHFLNKQECKNNILYTIDKSQAIGDKGLSEDLLKSSLVIGSDKNEDQSKLNTVFRCSPDIVDLAFSVLASGATLFVNFENPMKMVNTSFTEAEERKSIKPVYLAVSDESELILNAFSKAETMVSQLDVSKSEILIVATTPELLSSIEKYSNQQNKPVEIIKNRGDFGVVKRAINTNRFVVGGIDYIGGLEFCGVVIVGVDKGRVPPLNVSGNNEGFHFMNYASHNRLYVAITRAKYALHLLGEKSRGVSDLLEEAIKKDLIDVS
jgi:hypothetical protein